MSLLDYAVAAVMIAHFQMVYMLLLHNTVHCCCLPLLLLLHITVVHVTVAHYCETGKKHSLCMYLEAQLHQV